MSAPALSPGLALGVVAAVVFGLVLLHWLLWRGLALLGRHLAAGMGRGRTAWARTHPLRAALATRFPVLYAWLAARLDPRAPSGLPLSLMVLAAVYLAAQLGGLVAELREAEELVAFDLAVNEALQPWRVPILVFLFAWITDLGAEPARIAVAITATGFLWAHGRRPVLLPLWVTILGASATTWIGKYAFDRTRPDFLTDVTALSPSFPSAHATGAMAVYGFIAYAITREAGTRRQRFAIGYWTAVLIGLIGLSRIFLGVHYVSDVAAGFLLGGFWLLVGISLAEWRVQTPPQPVSRP